MHIDPSRVNPQLPVIVFENENDDFVMVDSKDDFVMINSDPKPINNENPDIERIDRQSAPLPNSSENSLLDREIQTNFKTTVNKSIHLINNSSNYFESILRQFSQEYVTNFSNGKDSQNETCKTKVLEIDANSLKSNCSYSYSCKGAKLADVHFVDGKCYIYPSSQNKIKLRLKGDFEGIYIEGKSISLSGSYNTKNLYVQCEDEFKMPAKNNSSASTCVIKSRKARIKGTQKFDNCYINSTEVAFEKKSNISCSTNLSVLAQKLELKGTIKETNFLTKDPSLSPSFGIYFDAERIDFDDNFLLVRNHLPAIFKSVELNVKGRFEGGSSNFVGEQSVSITKQAMLNVSDLETASKNINISSSITASNLICYAAENISIQKNLKLTVENEAIFSSNKILCESDIQSDLLEFHCKTAKIKNKSKITGNKQIAFECHELNLNKTELKSQAIFIGNKTPVEKVKLKSTTIQCENSFDLKGNTAFIEKCNIYTRNSRIDAKNIFYNRGLLQASEIVTFNCSKAFIDTKITGKGLVLNGDGNIILGDKSSIEVGEDLFITTDSLENRGNIKSGGILKIKCTKDFSNLNTGQIESISKAAQILIEANNFWNSGQIYSDGPVLIKIEGGFFHGFSKWKSISETAKGFIFSIIKGKEVIIRSGFTLTTGGCFISSGIIRFTSWANVIFSIIVAKHSDFKAVVNFSPLMVLPNVSSMLNLDSDFSLEKLKSISPLQIFQNVCAIGSLAAKIGGAFNPGIERIGCAAIGIIQFPVSIYRYVDSCITFVKEPKTSLNLQEFAIETSNFLTSVVGFGAMGIGLKESCENFVKDIQFNDLASAANLVAQKMVVEAQNLVTNAQNMVIDRSQEALISASKSFGRHVFLPTTNYESVVSIGLPSFQLSGDISSRSFFEFSAGQVEVAETTSHKFFGASLHNFTVNNKESFEGYYLQDGRLFTRSMRSIVNVFNYHTLYDKNVENQSIFAQRWVQDGKVIASNSNFFLGTHEMNAEFYPTESNYVAERVIANNNARFRDSYVKIYSLFQSRKSTIESNNDLFINNVVTSGKIKINEKTLFIENLNAYEKARIEVREGNLYIDDATLHDESTLSKSNKDEQLDNFLANLIQAETKQDLQDENTSHDNGTANTPPKETDIELAENIYLGSLKAQDKSKVDLKGQVGTINTSIIADRSNYKEEQSVLSGDTQITKDNAKSTYKNGWSSYKQTKVLNRASANMRNYQINGGFDSDVTANVDHNNVTLISTERVVTLPSNYKAAVTYINAPKGIIFNGAKGLENSVYVSKVIKQNTGVYQINGDADKPTYFLTEEIQQMANASFKGKGKVHFKFDKGRLVADINTDYVGVETNTISRHEDFLAGRGKNISNINPNKGLTYITDHELILSSYLKRNIELCVVAAFIQYKGYYNVEALRLATTKKSIVIDNNITAKNVFLDSAQELLANNSKVTAKEILSVVSKDDTKLNGSHLHGQRAETVSANLRLIGSTFEGDITTYVKSGDVILDSVDKEVPTTTTVDAVFLKVPITQNNWQSTPSAIIGGTGEEVDGSDVHGLQMELGKLEQNASHIESRSKTALIRGDSYTTTPHHYQKTVKGHHDKHTETTVFQSIVKTTDDGVLYIDLTGDYNATALKTEGSVKVHANSYKEDSLKFIQKMKYKKNHWYGSDRYSETRKVSVGCETVGREKCIVAIEYIFLIGSKYNLSGDFKAFAGKKIVIITPVLQNSVKNTRTGFGASFFGLHLFGDKNAKQPFFNMDPALLAMIQLKNSQTLTSVAINGLNAAVQVFNAYQTFSNVKTTAEFLQAVGERASPDAFNPSLKFSFQVSKNKSQYDSLAPSYINAKNVHLSAVEQIDLNVQVNARQDIHAAAKVVHFSSEKLESKSKSNTYGGSVAFKPQDGPKPTVGVMVGKGKSRATLHPVNNINAGNKLIVEAEVFEIEDTHATADSADIKASKVRVTANQNASKGNSYAVGAATDGSVFVNLSNNSRKKAANDVGLFVNQSLFEDNYQVEETHLKGGKIVSNGVANVPGKVTSEDVKNKSRKESYGVSANVRNIAAEIHGENNNANYQHPNALNEHAEILSSISVSANVTKQKQKQHGVIHGVQGSDVPQAPAHLVTNNPVGLGKMHKVKEEMQCAVPLPTRKNIECINNFINNVSKPKNVKLFNKFSEILNIEDKEEVTKEVRRLADIALHVYDADHGKEELEKKGLRLVDNGVYYDSEYETHIAFYADDVNKKGYIAVRGTYSVTYLATTDVEIALANRLEELYKPECQDFLLTNIDALKERGYSVTIAGHSGGASQSTVLSSEYKIPAVVLDNPGVPPGVYDASQVVSLQSPPDLVNAFPKLFAKGSGYDYGNVYVLPKTIKDVGLDVILNSAMRYTIDVHLPFNAHLCVGDAQPILTALYHLANMHKGGPISERLDLMLKGASGRNPKLDNAFPQFKF
jgi:hypothetical protein